MLNSPNLYIETEILKPILAFHSVINITQVNMIHTLLIISVIKPEPEFIIFFQTFNPSFKLSNNLKFARFLCINFLHVFELSTKFNILPKSKVNKVKNYILKY